jgi:hypothetical protein
MGKREQGKEHEVSYCLKLISNVYLHYQGHCTTRRRLANRPQRKGNQSSLDFKVRENWFMTEDTSYNGS